MYLSRWKFWITNHVYMCIFWIVELHFACDHMLWYNVLFLKLKLSLYLLNIKWSWDVHEVWMLYNFMTCIYLLFRWYLSTMHIGVLKSKNNHKWFYIFKFTWIYVHKNDWSTCLNICKNDWSTIHIDVYI